jgi:hypothetical protein
MFHVETPSSRDEELLLDAVKQAVDLVDRDGLTPDAALTKVAREKNLTPGRIKLVGHAYNTGRQTRQREDNTSILAKLAAFPLCDPAAVAAAVYGPEKKAEAIDPDYNRSPGWLGDARRVKAASAAWPDIKEPAPRVPAPEPYRQSVTERAIRQSHIMKRGHDALRAQASRIEDTLHAGFARLVGYFRKAAHDRLPFDVVEHAALTYLGPLSTPLLAAVHAQARSKEAQAAEAPLKLVPVNLAAEPFTVIERCLKAAEDLGPAEALVKTSQRAIEAFEAVYQDWGRAVARGDKEAADKAAAIMSPAATGAMVSTLLNRSLGGMPATKSDLVEDAMNQLEDPAHRNELRKIRVHAMLNSMLTDPDDPISSHSPDAVVSAFNEISQLAPRVADQPAALRPLLRRRLQGHTEPFEVKEITDIEKGIGQSRELSQTPSAKKE